MYCYLTRGLILAAIADFVLSALVGIPTTPFEAGSGSFSLSSLSSIVVDSQFADASDSDGLTLIPPSLSDFAATFAADLGSGVDVITGESPASNSIFLTIGNDDGFIDRAGRRTSEAYRLDVASDGITVTGASPLGVWWGTRTILQQNVFGNGEIPMGSGVDAPGWGSRGVMLDVGRHFYPTDFLLEICSFISYFKQNTFHVHLSDNLFTNGLSDEEALTTYAAFRLNSDDPAVDGLNTRLNESYTRDEFDTLQAGCAARGVTIIPEIEAPGHALVIVQWRPELGLITDLTLLNISHSDTIPTMQTIWRTFLPWFQSKVVHIGADEYSNQLIPEYTRFVIEMNDFISAESGKEMRIWGTFTPLQGSDVNTSVSIQHWSFNFDNPLTDYINNGYSVLNSDDGFYVVGKFSSYPQQLNETRVFAGNPAGGPFAPNIFDTNRPQNNPPESEPAILGHIAAQWNDWGPNATSVLEAYYAWRDVLPGLADKQWGGKLTQSDYDSIFESLIAAAPGQNLDRRIASQTSTILNYTLLAPNDDDATLVQDSSGNGYDGQLSGDGCSYTEEGVSFDGACFLQTPLGSKGRNYTLSFSINPTSDAPAALFFGPDSSLLSGIGDIGNVTFLTGGNIYPLNYSLPIGEWTDAKLIGRGAQSFLAVDGGDEQEFLTVIRTQLVWTRIAIEAPLARIGEGFAGTMRNIVLEDFA